MQPSADVDASTSAPVRANENAASSGRLRGGVPSAVVVVGATVMIIGSTQEWATFSGGFLMSLVDRSGVELGYGIVTLVCGVGVGLIGLGAARRGGVTPYRRRAVLLSLVALATVVLAYTALVMDIGEMYSGFGGLLSHGEALYAVGISAATCSIAARGLRLPKGA